MKRMVLAGVALAALFFAAGAVFASNGVKECVPKGTYQAILTPDVKGGCPTKAGLSYKLEELGKEGPEGKQGEQGKEGPPGPSGSSHGYSATSSNVAIAEGKNLVPTPVVSVKVPPGKYMVWASGNLKGHEAAVDCALAGGPYVTYTFEEARLPYALNSTVSLPSGGEIALLCEDEVSGHPAPEAETNEITALKVDEIN